MTNIDEILASYYDAKKKMTETVTAAINPMFDSFFEKYPTLESFSWTQYTPYFNDGDTCQFSVHSWPDINETAEWDIAHGTPEYEISKDIGSFLAKVPEEVFLDLYGDHSRITIKRLGEPVIEDYEHD